ncbi:DUF2063 domain-containing protein, partial [Xanthomonas citri pv. citri]|nr:DUF2063 domain-containing protein [Xanthomonas citri pv. citri]
SQHIAIYQQLIFNNLLNLLNTNFPIYIQLLNNSK